MIVTAAHHQPRTYRAPQPSSGAEPGGQAAAAEAPQGGSEMADAVGYAVGGATGLALGIAALYVGTLGGAALGGLIGGGLGPIVASISSEGALNFIGTAFSTAGTMTQAGIVVGGLTGLVGAFAAGKKLGDSARDTINLVTGNREKAELRRQRQPLEGTGRLVSSALTGAGAVAGGIGGFLAGAALFGIAGLVTGGGAGAAALTGGALGGATFGVLGGLGGLHLSRGVVKTASAGGKLAGKAVGPLLGGRYRRVEALEAEETRQAERSKELSDTAWRLDKQELSQDRSFREALGDLQGREAQAQEKLEDANGQIARGAEQLYATEHPAEAAQHVELSEALERVSQAEAALAEKEAALAAVLDRQAADFVEKEKPAIEADFARQNLELDAREGTLAADETAIKKSVRQQAAPRLAREAGKLQDDIKAARENETRARNYRDAVKQAADSATTRREKLEEDVAKARAELDYWTRVVEQLKKGGEAQ